MIVVAIISLLAMLAIPSFVKARRQAQLNQFINDLRVAVDAFMMYELEHGAYPPDRTPGVIPPGMADYLRGIDWTGTTPVGGQWDWDYGQFGHVSGVSVYLPDRTPTEMREIDRRLDDGNLSTGLFRSRSQGYIYIIE